jgi:bifunctional non-homologous end joining protein LigD
MVETLCMAKSDMRSTAHASRGRVRATRKDPHPELTAHLERLQGQATAFELDIDHRHRLMVKHPAKVLWPQLGITTVDLIQYYLRVAPVLLPHTQDRPLSFRRFNEGIEGPSQFHQRIKWPTPAGVRTASFRAKGKQFDTRLIGGDLTTLLYCVNLAIISQDVWLSRLGEPDRPDYAVFDLDPHASLPFKEVVDVAWRLHQLLDEYRVPHGVKTSGVSGLHIYVPVVNADYHMTRMFVAQFARKVADHCPELATVVRTIQQRGRRVYLDPDQNMRAKTMSAPYSARHSAFAGVSAPVSWQELRHGARPEDFTICTMPARVRATGDLWKTLRQRPLDLGRVIPTAA